jgi:uncharacterized OB-fold protein
MAADATREAGSVVPLQLSLSYDHALGDLSPYFAGLMSGLLIATRCPKCAAVRLPPRLWCPCGSQLSQWVQLSGLGTVVASTRTKSSLPATQVRGQMTFALIEFDGASNRALVRCRSESPLPTGVRVRLAPPSSHTAHPVQALEVVAV